MEKLTNVVFQKWFTWIEKIRDDLFKTVNRHQVFCYLIEVITENDKHIADNNGKKFCNSSIEAFVESISLGIRRQEKVDKKSISLMRLMLQLSRYTDQFTYEFYLKQFPKMDGEPPWQEWTFTNFSNDRKTLCKEIIENDMNELKEISNQILLFTDRTVAHLDKRSARADFTLDDLYSVVESYNKLACKYLSLITAKGYVTLKPTIQYNWKNIFTVPLDMRDHNND